MKLSEWLDSALPAPSTPTRRSALTQYTLADNEKGRELALARLTSADRARVIRLVAWRSISLGLLPPIVKREEALDLPWLAAQRAVPAQDVDRHDDWGR